MMKVAVLLMLLSSALGYNILGVFPVPSRSHDHLAKGIVGALLKAGHQVTWVTPFPEKKEQKGLKVIDVSLVLDLVAPIDMLNMNTDISVIKEFGRNISILAATDAAVQRALQTERFDAVITEWFFSDVQAGYAAALQIPWILLSGTVIHANLEALVDEIRSAPLVPAFMVDFPIPMNLWQRMVNTFVISMMTIGNWMDFNSNEALYKELFSPIAEQHGVTLPPYSAALSNVSILLVNAHPSLAPALSLPPNVVHIGGYHISEHHDPLPKDLQELLDNSKQGVVYFSMGSVLKSKNIPQNTRQDLIRILGELPYTVLWKFEEPLEGLPKNVYVRPWLPQPAILAHPNIKLFITHGGLLSTLEALHAGVPILAIPVFGDQPSNANRATRAGYALNVPFAKDMGPKLKVALREILGDDKYYKQARHLSKLFRSRPVPPAQLIQHYVQLAIETQGAYHLRSQARHYQWYERWMLDQLAVVLLALYLLVKLIKYAVSLALSLCSGKKEGKKLKKK